MLSLLRRSGLTLLAALGAGAALFSSPALADEHDPAVGRSTAVALNYCRASFHRILRYPSKRVLLEEQEKILNNLNLNGIADEEVVRLYSAVLHEISEVQIADRERVVITETSKRAFRRQLAMSAFALGPQLATAQYLDAARTGCSSWWDYRGSVWTRELETWKVEKTRVQAVTDKSSLFLDTFWKLARKRQIADRWLVRGEDVDRLETALQEPNAEVRLRVLQRMQPFMECYPPYWYYLGRTQQALGQWTAAAQTYQHLAELGEGHFRRDELLAAGLANCAVIQDYLGLPTAAETAQRALECATGAWEVNLLCGRVLERHGRIDAAEDALLRNLDVDLEREQSLASLLGLYYRTQNRRQLAARLADSETLRIVPLPVLAECAALVGPDLLPRPALQHMAASLSVDFDLRFGADDVVLALGPAWQVHNAQVTLQAGGQRFAQPALSTGKEHMELRFRQVAELGGPLNPAPSPPPLALVLHYPGLRPIQLHLRAADGPAGATGPIETALLPLPFLGKSSAYRLAALDVGDARLALDPALAAPRTAAPTVPPMAAEPPAIATEPTIEPVRLLATPPPPAVSDALPPLE